MSTEQVSASSLSIAEQLSSDLKDAMRARDKARLACIRGLKSKLQDRTNAKDFDGKVDDALHVTVIGAQVKSLKKGIAELEVAGDQGAALRAQYQTEIDYFQQFLPQLLDEAATATLVKAAIAESGASEPKDTGRVMGSIMKSHRGKVDAQIVKKLVGEALQAGG